MKPQQLQTRIRIYIWIIQFGMIACVLIFPLAFIAGTIRHIPLFWRFVDCSFGVIGIVPLWLAYRATRKLESQAMVTLSS